MDNEKTTIAPRLDKGSGTPQRTQLHYISGLKGLACFFVMIGHYFCLLKYIEAANFDYSAFGILEQPPLSFLINESFWLYLFFIASGFLLAMGRVDRFSSLIVKIVRRFFRLGIPILFSCAVIYVLTLCVGIHNQETASLFTNSWYQSAYGQPLTLTGVLLSPFEVLIAGKCIFNSPYWVLREMLIASVVIYVCMYVQAKLSRKKWVFYAVGYGFLAVSFFASNVIFACVLGSILAQHRHIAERFLLKCRWPGVIVSFACVILAILYPATYTGMLLFSVLILTVPSFPWTNRLFSGKVPMLLGKISFGVYSFHWPVYCSIGACLLLATWQYGLLWAFLIGAVSSVVITFILSYVYSITAEKAANTIVARITSLMTSVLDRCRMNLSR